MRSFLAKHSIWTIPWAYLFLALILGFLIGLFSIEKIPVEIQTLIAGILGLIGVAWLVSVNGQNRYRKTRAVRALLPLALSEIYDYLNQTLVCLSKYLKESRHLPSHQPIKIDHTSLETIPPLPEKHLEIINTVIEYGPMEVGDALIEILENIQILRARMRTIDADLQKFVPARMTLADQVIYTADLCERIDLVFHYSRRERETATTAVSRANMKSKLFFLGVYEEDEPELFKALERRYPDEKKVERNG